MANTSERKSAGLKAVRSDKKRAARNAAQKGAIEVQERMMKKAIVAKDSEAIKKIQLGLQKLYDKATKNNIMHNKTADRKKSRLAKRVATTTK
ncbi:MAG: 30S ribosomal protein S20 [Parcubacteria group bacterium]|nr:30S ribosomal protein S20 [Parcubacteria group bacterium]|tara:strand:- start:1599 stop:1877 length:279 start_codon:yes stop_codon:yes gene_type:complete